MLEFLNGGSEINRHALVIGNAAYPSGSALESPGQDAEAVAATLRDLEFNVTLANDCADRDMLRIFRQFRDSITHAEAIVFYYSGHGLQFRGENFLVPVDVDLNDDGQFEKLISLPSLINDLADKSGTNVVILDACRSNPFATALTRSVARAKGLSAEPAQAALLEPSDGLGEMDVRPGTLIAFAAAPGRTAWEPREADDKESLSVFTRHLVRHMPTNGLGIQAMLRRVARDVVKESNDRGAPQTPWVSAAAFPEFTIRPIQYGLLVTFVLYGILSALLAGVIHLGTGLLDDAMVKVERNGETFLEHRYFDPLKPFIALAERIDPYIPEDKLFECDGGAGVPRLCETENCSCNERPLAPQDLFHFTSLALIGVIFGIAMWFAASFAGRKIGFSLVVACALIAALSAYSLFELWKLDLRGIKYVDDKAFNDVKVSRYADLPEIFDLYLGRLRINAGVSPTSESSTDAAEHNLSRIFLDSIEDEIRTQDGQRAFFVAGGFGAIVLFILLSLFHKEFRSARMILLALFAGSAGVLPFIIGADVQIHEHGFGFDLTERTQDWSTAVFAWNDGIYWGKFLLTIPWQALVAACIGYALITYVPEKPADAGAG